MPESDPITWSSDEPEEVEPWLLVREGETSAAYSAYCHWLRTLPAARTLRGTARAVGVNRKTANRWSRVFDWAGRARGYDAHRERELTKLAEAALTMAEQDRIKLVVASVKYMKTAILRDLADLEKDPTKRASARKLESLMGTLRELSLLQGKATEISETRLKETGEALKAKVDELLDNLGERLPESPPQSEQPPPLEESNTNPGGWTPQ